MATGTPPASRRDHAATVLPDGNSVFIHGGTDKTYGTFMADIAILNCTGQTSCNWQAPPNLTPPPGRYAHTATLIDNFVIIAFGFTAKETGDSNIYIYDISKFAWVKSYQPAASYTPPPPITSSTSTTTSSTLASVGPAIPSESSPPASSSPSPSATAGATIGSIAGAAALGALVFVFYKRRNKSDGAAANRRVSSFEQHDAFSATSDSSGSGPTPLGHRFSMIFQGRNTVDSQRYSWHPSSQIRPPTMVSEYYRPNRTSTISHPGPTYNNNPRFSQHMHDMNATTEDLVGVDVGSSYFMPRRELFVVNADSDSK
ncbi:Leucine-zipper-like transcriptional regulator 1 [Umbelopsis nana]